MRSLRRRKPSPAMVVSIVAVTLSVAGTSVAGVATISVLSKKEKKQTRNIAKDEIKKAAPGLSVANATNAANAMNAATATDANLLDGLDSTAFQVRGYRRESTGSVTPSVAGISVLDFNYAAPTVVTNLTGGLGGQVVTLTTINPNVDIMDGGTFVLSANWAPDGNDTLTLTSIPQGASLLWFEVSRSVN